MTLASLTDKLLMKQTPPRALDSGRLTVVLVGSMRPNDVVVVTFAVVCSLSINRYVPRVLRKPTHLGSLPSIASGNVWLDTKTCDGARPGP